MPLAGQLQLGGTTMSDEAIRTGLNDTERKRYTYAGIPGSGLQIITPLPAAMAPYLSAHKLAFDNWNKLDQQLNDNLGVWRMFICPMTDALERHREHANSSDTTPLGQGTMMVVSFSGFMMYFWSTNSDFAMNEGVFGYDYRAQYASRRLAGKLSRVARPCETMLFCDANPGKKVDPGFPFNFPYPWITFTPALDPVPGPITLADALEENNKVMPNRASVDLLRHRGRINVVFADGHVESLMITPASLQRVLVATR